MIRTRLLIRIWFSDGIEGEIDLSGELDGEEFAPEFLHEKVRILAYPTAPHERRDCAAVSFRASLARRRCWADLCRRAPDATTPEWHADILAERERRLAAGEEVVLDWEEAKRRLRREIDEGQDS